MVCINCSYEDTRVINSRANKKTPRIWRRRTCPQCHYTFTTHEIVAQDDYLYVETEPFSIAKLTISLFPYLTQDDSPEETAYWLAQTVAEKLIMKHKRSVDRTTLLETTHAVLGRYSPAAAIAYGLHYRLVEAAAKPRRGRPTLKRRP